MILIEVIIETFPDETFVKIDGFDKALIGVDDVHFKLIYSVKKILDILQQEQGMTMEEAREYYEFNISGAHFGEKTPIYCNDVFDL